MVGRLLGALTRAVFVLFVFMLPAVMLPDIAQSALEMSLIVGGLVAAFVLIEYGASQPALLDFRFAPPYNRARFVTFATILVALVFLVRATVAGGDYAPGYLATADRLAALMDFPYSPVSLVPALTVGETDPALALLIRRAAALSLSIGLVALVFFGLLLWVFKWPQGRERFNLWKNLPTFEPTQGRSVERRLMWRGRLYIIVGLTLPFTLAVLASRAVGLVDAEALANTRNLVWGVAIWAFMPVSFVIRGLALSKIGWLVRRARGAG
jgi:hypothetical protein